MTISIHLCNGDILCDPVEGQFSRSLTIESSIVSGIDAPAPKDIQIVDLEGKCAVPGFVDSHLHLTLGAAGLGDVDLGGALTKESFVALLVEGATQVSGGSWLVASGWTDQSLGQLPDKSWLDDLGDLPTICFSLDLHTAVINDSVISLLNMDHICLLPGSEQISNGIVREDALFESILSLIPPVEIGTRISRTRCALQMMHARGITLIGTMETVEDIKQILSILHREQIMRIRVMCLDDPTPDKIKFCTSMNDEFLQVTGFKSFLDGSLGSRTAKMYEPWKDVEGDGVWAGVAASGMLNDWIATVTKSNFSPVVHAIGDQAVSLALDALADVSEELIPRIEHAQFIADRDIEKIRNKWFGIQPLHQPHDALTASIAVNEQQASLLHNWRRMVDAGGKLSFGSDWPVAPPDPLAAMRVAIEQGLSRSEALAMSTSIAADSLRTPKAGRFEIGSYGDVVVLDRNPLECDWKKQSPSVIMTILGGKVQYRRDLRNA